MGRKKIDADLEKRIRKGEIRKQDVTRRLAELAFGKANDCVRLVLEESVCLETLDLSLLSEVKRSSNGAVEVRLIDRLQVLARLAEAAKGDSAGAEAFLQALQGGDGA